MSLLLNPIPNVVIIAGLAVPLLPSDAQAVPLPPEYYAQSAQADAEPETSGPPARPHVSQAQLQEELDSALQKSGLRADIENEESGLTTIRFVQADTGATVLQLPPQTVPDLIDTLTKAGSESFPDLAGHLVDQSA